MLAALYSQRCRFWHVLLADPEGAFNCYGLGREEKGLPAGLTLGGSAFIMHTSGRRERARRIFFLRVRGQKKRVSASLYSKWQGLSMRVRGSEARARGVSLVWPFDISLTRGRCWLLRRRSTLDGGTFGMLASGWGGEARGVICSFALQLTFVPAALYSQRPCYWYACKRMG